MKKKKVQKNIEESNMSSLDSGSIDLLHIYDSVPIPIAIYNNLDNSVRINSKFTEAYGYSNEDIKSLDDWWNLCIPDEKIRIHWRNEWWKSIQETIRSNSKFNPIEMDIHCKNGSKKFIQYSHTVINDDYVGFFADITDLKQSMEKKLLLSERRTNSLLYSPKTIPMAIFDRNGVILEMNEAAIRETKISADKLIGKNIFSLMKQYGIKNIYNFEEVIKKKQAINFKADFLNSKYDIEYYPLLNDKEEVEKVAFYARNLSDIFLKERLQDSEIKFKTFMEHGPFLAYIKDKDGKYIYGNPAVHKFIKSYADIEFVGSSVGAYFDKETTDEMVKYDNEIIKHKKPIIIPPHSHKDKSGNISWMKEIKFPIPISQDEVLIGGIVLFVTDEILLQEKFEESERKARILLDAPSDPIALLDKTGRIIDLNTACAENLNMSRENAIGKNLSDLYPSGYSPDHKTHRDSLFEKIIKDKKPIEFLRNYNSLILQVRMFPIFDSNDEVEWIALFIHDITNLKENERKLQLTQFSVDHSSIPIMIVSEDGLITYANVVACELLGYINEELIQLHVWDLNKELKSKKEFRKTLKELAPKTKFTRESIITKKNGTTFPAQVTVNKMQLHNEIHYVVYIQDITLQKRNERELAKLFSATHQSPISIVITDTNGTIEYINPKFCDISGYRPEELIGRNPRVLKSGYTTRSEYQKIYETLNNGEVWQGTFRNVKKDGSFYWESATISPIFGANGEITNYLGLKEDITEKIALQAQLEHSQKMEAMGRLAGSISHDFNNILTVIMGTAQLLQHDMVDDVTKESLDEIVKASNRAASLTRQLLAFSKKQVLKPKLLDLNSVLIEMENMIRRILPENIQLQIGLNNQPITIKVDKVQLEQVILNLVINAKEAMLSGGKLTISTYVSSKHIGNQLNYFGCLSIADTGVGMDEETKQRLFEPFFTTKQKGTGLGLATVYGIISQSKGEIEVDTDVGNGSIFKINFPLILNAISEKDAPIIKKSEWKGTETILLIEDEEAVRKVIYQILTNEGYTVWQAENGESAILNYSHLVDKIDLIVSDVIMPVMGGPEVVNKFHDIDPSLKALFITGYAGDGYSDGEDDFVAKPIERIRLLKKIREKLGYA